MLVGELESDQQDSLYSPITEDEIDESSDENEYDS